jgi:hypothetical protein
MAGRQSKMPQNVIVSLHPSNLARIQPTMAAQSWSKLIEGNPIGKGLDAFRASFESACKHWGISNSPNALDQLDQEGMVP